MIVRSQHDVRERKKDPEQVGQGGRGGRRGGGAQGAAAKDEISRKPGRQHGRSSEPVGRTGDPKVPETHDPGGSAQARQLQEHTQHPGCPQALARRAA